MSQASTESDIHCATLSTPKLQLVAPDTVYPALHVGWQVLPEGSSDVHVPTPPFVGGALASHGFGSHVAAVSTPNEHDEVPDTV